MTTLTAPNDLPIEARPNVWRRVLASRRARWGGAIVVLMLLLCFGSLPWTLNETSRLHFDYQNGAEARLAPDTSLPHWFGTDKLGRSLLARCLLGGALSLGIGVASAIISLIVGVSVGLVSGYRGGKTDAVLMRLVDIMYGLPYILLVILFKVAFDRGDMVSGIVVLFMAIGLVSWLTMARVVRGQVLSLKQQPFIEAARANGLSEWRIFTRHLLPNMVGPITVYATLIVPQAILQESFLSFLGIGLPAPLPTWGSLASDGLLLALTPLSSHWWMLLFPCVLLGLTLLALNFLGDGLRDVFDPRQQSGRI